MRILAVVCLLLAVGFGRAALAADAPQELAGLRLGGSVEAPGEAPGASDADRRFHRPYLGMRAVAPVAGFRSGYVDFGLCAKPGRIVRIKMTYADDSLEFFNRLLDALKKRYGAPKEWRGNALGTLRTWKWSLHSAGGQAVSLILMHYEGADGAFTDGNSIRIAATDMVREEQQCQAARDGVPRRVSTPKSGTPGEPHDLDWFLPH